MDCRTVKVIPSKVKEVPIREAEIHKVRAVPRRAYPLGYVGRPEAMEVPVCADPVGVYHGRVLVLPVRMVADGAEAWERLGGMCVEYSLDGTGDGSLGHHVPTSRVVVIEDEAAMVDLVWATCDVVRARSP